MQKISVVTAPDNAPDEVKSVCAEINDAMSLYPDDFPFSNKPDGWNDLFVNKYQWYSDAPSNFEHWFVGSNFEDVSENTFYRVDDNSWYYREASTGNDYPVRGGREAVIANWIMYYTG